MVTLPTERMACLMKFTRILLVTTFVTAAGPAAAAQFLTLASTTSTENSGLFDHILPKFTAQTGVEVRVVAVGTGQAIRLARNGDADALLVHHRESEERFVTEGFGVSRHEVMYNDFVLVGPRNDPAGVQGAADAQGVLARIAQSQSLFVSRGDDSGTHKAEQALWRSAGIHPQAASGTWYRELGAGMGATLNGATAMGAYTLVDRATWIGFANKNGFVVVFEGDRALFNQYAVILVSPERHPHVKASQGREFLDWLLSPDGQSAIRSFRVGDVQMFFPNARKPNPAPAVHSSSE